LAAPLPDDGQIAFAERVVTDQLILGVRQRQQAYALSGARGSNGGVCGFLLLENIGL
jgi:hypothetical protein